MRGYPRLVIVLLMNATHNPEQMSNPGHCVTMNEVNRVIDLRHELVTDFYTGLAAGWDQWTMKQLSSDIAKCDAMLPEWCR